MTFNDLIKFFWGFILLCFLCFKSPSIVSFFGHFVVFLYWKIIDLKLVLYRKKRGIVIFRPFGVKMFCGRQGEGKTIGLTWYLEKLHKKYPKAHIYTNFDFKGQTGALNNLKDLLLYRNGQDGVVFAIDEIQNEFSSAVSKDFPETLLSEITMQRKQRITILCSSQVFMRVAKPLREQCYEVIECRTFFGRWTRLKCYDADDYNMLLDAKDYDRKIKIRKKWKRSFIQSDLLRDSFDTYEKVQRLSRQGFASKLPSV